MHGLGPFRSWQEEVQGPIYEKYKLIHVCKTLSESDLIGNRSISDSVLENQFIYMEKHFYQTGKMRKPLGHSRISKRLDGPIDFRMLVKIVKHSDVGQSWLESIIRTSDHQATVFGRKTYRTWRS